MTDQTTTNLQLSTQAPIEDFIREPPEEYFYGLNSNNLNAIMHSPKTLQRVGKTNEYRAVSGHVVIIKTNKLEIEEMEIKGLSVPEKQALFTLIELFKQNNESRTFYFTVEDYMHIRGLTDKKETKQQMKTLFNSLACYTFILDDEKEDYQDAGARKIIEWTFENNPIFEVEFGKKFYNDLKKAFSTLYPKKLLTLNTSQEGVTWELLQLLHSHKRTNPETNTIYTTLSLRTIFNKCHSLPRLENVEKKYYKRQIINPIQHALEEEFDRDNIFFIDENKKRIAKDDIPNDLEIIKNLSVQIKWDNARFPEEKLEQLKIRRAGQKWRNNATKQPRKKAK